MIKQREFLSNLQFARFLAALIVLVGHVFHEAGQQGLGFVNTGRFDWSAGVDIFFVISGFVMGLQDKDDFGSKIASQDFLYRRIIRIVPLYWAFTVLMIIAARFFSSHVAHSAINLPHVVASFLFLPWQRADGNIRPFLIAGWTLNYEMLFYIIFATGMRFRKGLYYILATIVLLALLGLFVHREAWLIYFWTRSIILEFVYGILLALLRARGVRIGFLVQCLLIAVASILLIFVVHKVDVDSEWRGVWTAVPAVLIVSGLVLGPEPKNSWVTRALVLGGGASYALYLSHPFSINVLVICLRKIGINSLVTYVIGASLLSIAVSIPVFQYFERPLLRFANTYRHKRVTKSIS